MSSCKKWQDIFIRRPDLIYAVPPKKVREKSKETTQKRIRLKVKQSSLQCYIGDKVVNAINNYISSLDVDKSVKTQLERLLAVLATSQEAYAYLKDDKTINVLKGTLLESLKKTGPSFVPLKDVHVALNHPTVAVEYQEPVTYEEYRGNLHEESVIEEVIITTEEGKIALEINDEVGEFGIRVYTDGSAEVVLFCGSGDEEGPYNYEETYEVDDNGTVTDTSINETIREKVEAMMKVNNNIQILSYAKQVVGEYMKLLKQGGGKIPTAFRKRCNIPKSVKSAQVVSWMCENYKKDELLKLAGLKSSKLNKKELVEKIIKMSGKQGAR